MTGTVFISGAGKGLGFALGRQFIDAGYHVFAGERSPSQHLADLRERHPQVLTILPLDIGSMDSIRQAAQAVGEKTPALDILVNNAAVYQENKLADLEDLD